MKRRLPLQADAGRGWDCRLSIRAHVGPVVEGRFGGAGAKAYDVPGKALNSREGGAAAPFPSLQANRAASFSSEPVQPRVCPVAAASSKNWL